MSFDWEQECHFMLPQFDSLFSVLLLLDLDLVGYNSRPSIGMMRPSWKRRLDRRRVRQLQMLREELERRLQHQ